MGLIVLHRKYFYSDFKNYPMSFAGLTTLIVICVALMIPLFGVSTTKVFIMAEQPETTQIFQYSLIAEHSTGNKITICETIDQSRQKPTSDCTKIRILEKDKNFDGKSDEILVSFEFFSLEYGIKSFSLMIFFESHLSNICHISASSLITLNQKSIKNGRSVVVYGSLYPIQNQPLICPYFSRNVQSHFFNASYTANGENVERENFVKHEDFNHYPMYFRFHEIATSYQEFNHQKTSITLHVKIPQVHISYKKKITNIALELWKSFFSLVIITLILSNLMLQYLFEKKCLKARLC